MSRLRENPERLFEVFIEIGKPTDSDLEPFILQKYPQEYNDEEVLKSVAKFAFPCETERYTETDSDSENDTDNDTDTQSDIDQPTTVDHFTFTLTDLESKYKFGFCRHATGAQTCFCIISFLPWFEVFYGFLNILAEITNRSEENDVTYMLREAYAHEVPLPGVPVTVVAGKEMFSFKSPENNKLPSIPASRNLTEYYNAIDTNNMAHIFASMLHERRIVVLSKKLSRLTAVIHASVGLLYPMIWQHLYIPVLPTHLIDYIHAPMPYVIGVHTKLFERVKMADLGDAVVVDADNNTVSSEYNDLEDLPEEIASHLKRHLKGEKVKNSMQGTGDVISKTFMLALVKLIGGYRDALKFNEGDTITFNPVAFVQSRPLSMQPFLECLLQLQIFQEFINDRLDMLNCGKGFADMFEQECLLHVDKLNAQSRYKDWLHNMKKQGRKVQRGGKDVWADFKDKAGPAMTSAVESVKSHGKKAVSGFRTKFAEPKKEERSMSIKSARLGAHSKTFIKERPSTIVGQPLSAQRPPRPMATSSAFDGRPPRPQLTVTSGDRRSAKRDTERVSAEDTDILMYNRVSCNLMSDPDIQSAMFKSASAENLPKQDPSLQSSSSSDSVSSEHNDVPYIDDPSLHRGSRLYSNLVNEDSTEADANTHWNNSNNLSQQIQAPTLPPRKRMSMQPAVQDRLVQSAKSSRGGRLPPVPARRKSLDKKLSQTNTFDTTTRTEELLINLDSPSNDITSRKQDLSFLDGQQATTGIDETDQSIWANVSGEKTPQGPARRTSISRTPAMKVPADQTPNRVSIRRERSPITPDREDKPATSMLFFDPLFGQSNNSSSYSTPVRTSEAGPQRAAPVSDTNSDSLLKDWDIRQFTSLPFQQFPPSESVTAPRQNSPSFQMHASSTSSPAQSRFPPTAAPRNAPFRPVSCSPFLAGQRKTVSTPTQQPVTSVTRSDQGDDPFADLVSLQTGPKLTGPKSPSPAPAQSWETFD